MPAAWWSGAPDAVSPPESPKPHRQALREVGTEPYIAKRNTEHGSGLGVRRWVVERTLSWLHQFRRLRIRYERRGDM